MAVEDQIPDALQSWTLADGAEVPQAVATTVALGVRDLLEKYGPVAAVDLTDIARGKQPLPTPFGNPKEIYPAMGIAELYADGTLHMHDLVKDVVRNSVHIDPNDPFRFAFTDPREPFSGFNE